MSKKDSPTKKEPVDSKISSDIDDEEGVKCFVGNLPFTIKEDEIAEFFAESGKVLKVIIIKRYGRSLGFGFVSFETLEEAEKAVLLDKKELDGRAINIEIARKKQNNDEKKERKPRSQKPESRVDDEPKQGRSVDGGRRGGRTERGGRGGSRGGYGGRGGSRGVSARGKSGERKPRDPNGPLSDTMLFVSNLPYKVTDADLKSIFQEYNVTSAHVVRLRNGVSKGFGFVDVASKVEQQKVLDELQNVSVDGRELIIKVSLATQKPRTSESDE